MAARTYSGDVPDQPVPPEPRFRSWFGSMWLYTVLRFALFFVLWGILVLVGLEGLLAAGIALVLSVPLSFVLLARPRARFAANLEARVNAARAARESLADELDPDSSDER